jgi:NADPH:quinone reductase-like Zn-dependent oxidoreductase
VNPRKLQINRPGGYEVLKWVSYDLPELLPEEVRVKTRAVGVNYADCLVRWGVYESAKKFVGWPITPGFEFSGVVEAVGAAVTGFRVGDEVLGMTRFNAYSTHVQVPAHQLFKKPGELSFEEAAGFPAVYLTAYHALFQIGRLYPRSRILVHSAAGGVGTALCQLGKRAAFHVVGVVGSPHKVEVARAFGAEDVFVRGNSSEFWSEIQAKYPEGFDAVFDAQGPDSYKKSFELLRSTGKLFVYGAHGLLPQKGGRINWLTLAWKALKNPVNFKPFDLITHNRSVCGFNVSFLFDQREMIHEGMEQLLAAVKEGALRAPPVETFHFDDVAKAHQRIESGQSVGKIVLDPAPRT